MTLQEFAEKLHWPWEEFDSFDLKTLDEMAELFGYDVDISIGDDAILIDVREKHPAIGGDVLEYFEERKKSDPEYRKAFDEAYAQITESRVDKAERRKDLKCFHCPPNRKENAKRQPKHGRK